MIIYIFYKVYISFIGSVQESLVGVNSGGSDVLQLFTSTNLAYSVCFWTSFLLYLPGMVIINLFINEVNFKTHRQNIIDGWKRETFIYTKIYLKIPQLSIRILDKKLGDSFACLLDNKYLHS